MNDIDQESTLAESEVLMRSLVAARGTRKAYFIYFSAIEIGLACFVQMLDEQGAVMKVGNANMINGTSMNNRLDRGVFPITVIGRNR
jgi:hypothetical protein